MSTSRKASTGTKRSDPGPRDELKRTLERDTAVQGESDSEEEVTPRGPNGADAPTSPSARPAPAARRRKTTS